jgi:hypothetical protein
VSTHFLNLKKWFTITPVKNTRIFTGLIYIVVSFFSFLFPNIQQLQSSKLFLTALFFIGVIYVCDTIVVNLKGTSLLREIRKSRSNLISFLIVSTLGGILLDGVAKFLGGLWVYPDWSNLYYLLIFIPGFAVYWVVVTESYLATKTILDYFKRGVTVIGRSYAYEPHLFSCFGILGIGLVIFAGLSILGDFTHQSLPLVRDDSIRVISAVFSINFRDVLLLFLGSWLVLEFLEFFRKRASLIRDILHGYYVPLIAIVLGSTALSFLMELQNSPGGIWRYTNWPLMSYTFLGLPVVVWLVWPLQYITFLSLFRVFTTKESNEIWRGDTVR